MCSNHWTPNEVSWKVTVLPFAVLQDETVKFFDWRINKLELVEIEDDRRKEITCVRAPSY
jgi:hypothetical protein